MKRHDQYPEPEFANNTFEEEEFLREVYDETPVYAVSVFNPVKYHQALEAIEKMKDIVDKFLQSYNQTATYKVEFDKTLGVDLCFTIHLPPAGLYLSFSEFVGLLKKSPPFDFYITTPAWAHTDLHIIFKEVKTVLERQ